MIKLALRKIREWHYQYWILRKVKPPDLRRAALGVETGLSLFDPPDGKTLLSFT